MGQLIEFLNARLDEDERVAKAASDGPWYGSEAGPPKYHDPIVYDANHNTIADRAGWSDLDADDMRHMVRHDPTRTLREVGAKRAHIDAYQRTKRLVAQAIEGQIRKELMSVLRAYRIVVENYAAVYSDHPDYREEWRP